MAYFVKIKENQLKTNTYLKKLRKKCSIHWFLFSRLFYIKENHQISNNWHFIITKNHFTHHNVYWTINNPKFLLTAILNWTNTNQTTFLSVSFENKELNLHSINLFFSTTAQAISYATFERHCTYPEDLNLDLEVMWNQIRVKQEYSKKYTTNENRATRYSNAAVCENYERLCNEDSYCHVEFSEMKGWDGIHSRFNWKQTCNYEKNYDKIYFHM